MISRLDRRGAALATLAATLLLGACQSMGLSVPPDAEAARLAEAIGERASTFYAGLAAKAAPDCAFESNVGAYSAMRGDASALDQRVAAGPEDRVMRNAAAGLARAVAAAENSHRLAPASSDDRFGVCMAPGAIKLNADAIARATAAITNLQRERSR